MPPLCRRLWRDHSLTIVLAVLGLTATAIAFLSEPGTAWWDVFIGIGQGCLTVVLFYALAGTLRERNRPED
jgi:hypothetical protein